MRKEPGSVNDKWNISVINDEGERMVGLEL
jgi:hypothetical protein